MAPTVSVCLPVYNAERYLEEAIDAVWAQSLRDFELILSDNGSTDRTESICRAAARSDSRVRYFRSPDNRGLAWNFNNAFALAEGRFLLWQGSDDRMEPDYLAACVEALERDPELALCFSSVCLIDETGVPIREFEPENAGASASTAERLHRILFDELCHPIMGVMRMETLRQTRRHLPYADSDRVLLSEMGLRGRFERLPAALFRRRMHSGQTTQKYADRWERTLVFDPEMRGRAIVPWLRQIRDLVSAVRRAPLTRKERWNCYKAIWWWTRAHRRQVVEDVRRGVSVSTRRFVSATS